ncbi:MAG: ATP-dependent DNA helicase RecG [Nitrospirae bacterium]|nr:ATP-dependent DNA helicase RecG [Nitrospirota bacterium]
MGFQMDIQKDIQYLKGVGPARAKLFNKLGIHTVEDLINYIPFRYEDRGNLKPIKELLQSWFTLQDYTSFKTVQGKIVSSRIIITPRQGRKIFEAVVGDGSGYITAKWFNQAYLKDVLKKDRDIVLSGYLKRDNYSHELYMDGPEYEIIDTESMPEDDALIHTGRIVPIYRVTNGLSQKVLRNIIKSALETYSVPEILPEDIIKKYHLPFSNIAINQIHFPSKGTDIEKLNRGETVPHKRLSFEEFLLLEVGLAMKKTAVTKESGIPFNVNCSLIDKLFSILPFKLTNSQDRVINEIKKDMAMPHPMNRLLQGDVGCGKTVVALMAMLVAVDNGYQAAMLVPTEVLAEQHYRNIKSYLDKLNIASAVLKSGMKSKEKKSVLESVSAGEIKILIGTHALLEGGVTFNRLGLAVIDEQHKFGVLQRAGLKNKGYNPDVLIMTATPIPRTLAMSVYGDLDVSVIDELPPGRTPVVTRWLYGNSRKEAYYIMQEELKKGRQAYVVYPLVEESEKVDLKSAVEMAERLQKSFPDYKTGLLHGRMKSAEKEEVMAGFKRNDIHILVSTTVIEVGVDVPNSTVMVIEHAERFGLSQLHQLRGRVGRGSDKSYCLLLTDGFVTDDGRKRLGIMEKTNNGFEIAEEDLAIRGPGELFGTRQAGIPELRVANIIRDVKILEAARKDAFEIISKDPSLSLPKHKLLRHAMERKWLNKLELGTIS